jgi:hypothetical protein
VEVVDIGCSRDCSFVMSLVTRPHIRSWLTRLPEPITLKPAVIFGQHVSEALDRALPLIER